jgi:hypothetical protein
MPNIHQLTSKRRSFVPAKGATKNRPVIDAEEAIATISDGLLLLEQVDLEKIGGKSMVDIAARMNAQYLALEKMLKPMKERVKAEAVTTNPTEYVRGNIFKAVISRFKKNYPDFAAIKRFLGPKWSACQETRNETQLSFEPQE